MGKVAHFETFREGLSPPVFDSCNMHLFDYHGRILRGGVGPPLRIFAPPLKSHAPPLGKVSMIDQSENVRFFGCLGSTLRKKVFL